ncbi:MAG TPA: DNA primase [Bryobacteraceae bacterium]|nr:DNA primase [Bryobacteraceae bacterium]
MNFAEQLKSSVDIVDVVGQYVRLRKAGPRWVGLCPFHTEKTPSFSVHSVLQIYKCFGCGVGGDSIKFVMEVEGLTFMEAMKSLSERYGIPMPKRAEYSDPETKLRGALFRMHEIARDLYHSALASPAGAEAQAYLKRRGVAPEMVEEFQIGLAADGWQTLTRALEREGFDATQLESSGLVLKRDSGGWFDRFRNRLMFPIQDESGRVIAFGGRALGAEQEPKYLNSSETPIYRKGHVLYSLHRAKGAIRKNDRAVLVEGYMDVIGVYSAGVSEVVATCGTALVSQQVRALRRHSEHIVVNFDPDPAGVKATERSIQILLDEGMRIRVLQLAGGLDPDEFVKENGAEAYRERLEKAPGYFHWLADRARAKYDTHAAEGRIAALQFLLPSIVRVSDRLERATIAGDIAQYMGVEAGLVLDHFRKAATERRDQSLQISAPVKRVESLLINAFVTSAEARGKLLPSVRRSPAIADFPTRRIFEALYAMEDAGALFSFAELEGRLEQADRDLLHKIVFTDMDAQEPEALLTLAEDSVRAIEASGREAHRSELRARARDAERAGNMAEALRIARELDALDREADVAKGQI